jgi:hypothetical protein
MADYTLQCAGFIPDGTLLRAYNAADFGLDPAGQAQGPVADEATVTDGEATFTGLDPSLYVAQAEVDGNALFVQFPANSSQPEEAQ